jgi:hypothetical protein
MLLARTKHTIYLTIHLNEKPEYENIEFLKAVAANTQEFG